MTRGDGQETMNGTSPLKTFLPFEKFRPQSESLEKRTFGSGYPKSFSAMKSAMAVFSMQESCRTGRVFNPASGGGTGVQVT